MKNLLRTSSIMVLALTMTGCATDPPAALDLPSLNLPSMFTAPVAKQAPIWPNADWWKGFGSAEMDGLIDTAQKSNLDLDAAVARVRQAEAQTEISGSVLFPDVTLSADATRTGSKVHGIGIDHNSFGISPAASYELDFWGKNRAQLRAAEESLKSAKFSQEVVGLTVTSGVANTYLDVLALRERVAIANKNIDAADRILAITQAKVTNGVASNLDLAQQEALVDGQKAQVPALVEQAKEAEYALAVLLGRAPEGFDVKGQNLDGILSPQVAPGVPSALLRRRPDVAVAEANLASAHANVDAARAAFFPSISLSAGGSYATTALGPTGLGYSIGASLLQTIFDGGNLLGKSRLARAQQRELVDTYRTTVLNAFVDVESSLGQVSSLAEQQKLKTDQVNAATEAFRISEIQYREGVADLLTVLQAQQTLFTAQDQLVQIKLARIQADIALYKALGGSWVENPDDATQPIPASATAPAKPAPPPQKG